MIRTKKKKLCKQQDLSVLNTYVLNKNYKYTTENYDIVYWYNVSITVLVHNII